ncbi:unnamed protein product [Symbiodinium natans]|uniref:Uncharacterized protein n=1 Tax=Symbiodinium natans TaxID=878477 RepID=A0A812GQC8_9DINO|nr:unnamed protein product [Symbiodinium natans]
MLAHYKGTADDWGAQWYKENVAGSFVGPGFKFKFMRDAYMKAKMVPEELKGLAAGALVLDPSKGPGTA